MQTLLLFDCLPPRAPVLPPSSPFNHQSQKVHGGQCSPFQKSGKHLPPSLTPLSKIVALVKQSYYYNDYGWFTFKMPAFRHSQCLHTLCFQSILNSNVFHTMLYIWQYKAYSDITCRGGEIWFPIHFLWPTSYHIEYRTFNFLLRLNIPYSGFFLWGANFRYFHGGCASHEIFNPRMFPPTYRRMLIILFLRRNREQTEDILRGTCPTVTPFSTIATANGSERLLVSC